jgi:hypothetical protein
MEQHQKKVQHEYVLWCRRFLPTTCVVQEKMLLVYDGKTTYDGSMQLKNVMLVIMECLSDNENTIKRIVLLVIVLASLTSTAHW